MCKKNTLPSHRFTSEAFHGIVNMCARRAHVLVGAFDFSPFDPYGGCMAKEFLVRYFTCLSLPTVICVELWGCSFPFGTDSWDFGK